MQQALIAPAGDESAGLLDMLRDAAGSFARGELGAERAARLAWAAAALDVNRWQAMAAMGWTDCWCPRPSVDRTPACEPPASCSPSWAGAAARAGAGLRRTGRGCVAGC